MSWSASKATDVTKTRKWINKIQAFHDHTVLSPSLCIYLSCPLPPGFWHALLLSMYLFYFHATLLRHFNSLQLLFFLHNSSFCYLLLPGNGFKVYSSLSLSISLLISASFSVSLSFSVSPLIGHCGWLSSLHCYGLCRSHYYETSIFLMCVCLRTERDTGRLCNPWCYTNRGPRLWPEHIPVVCMNRHTNGESVKQTA